MKLIFLGTGADDSIGMQEKFDFSDRNYRRCASAIIDDHILIDCGPHTLNALEITESSFEDISDLIITHFHRDHYCVSCIKKLASMKTQPLNIWCNSDAEYTPINNCVFHRMDYLCGYNISDCYVTGLPANHEAFPQHLSIEKDGKKLFYGLDGAWMMGETVRFLHDGHYNIVILDATVGDYCGDYRMGEHNSIPMIRLMKPSMRTLNIIDEDTNIYLSHMAVTLHKNYDETCKLTEKDGLIVAYDGLSVRV